MKRLVLVLFLAGIVHAQTPVTFSFFGQYIDYWLAHTDVQGDTWGFQTWANAATLALFPDPSGFPVVGAFNDGQNGSCVGNLGFMQISKLPPYNTPPTSGNTLLTAFPCMTSFGITSGDTNSPGNWNGNLTIGDGRNDGTWKGSGNQSGFHGGIFDFAPYRQTSQGSAFGDSTRVMSPDGLQHWVSYGNYSQFTVTGASCTSTTATLTVTNTLTAGFLVYVHDVGSSTANVYNGIHTLTSATGSTMVYTVPSCTGGTYTGGGAVGILTTGGDAPLGPASGAYPSDIMWQVSGGHNPMTQQIFILSGQDGSFPAELATGTGCDPNVWVCGYAIDSTFVQSQAAQPVILWRHPVGQGLVKSLYQWYTCATYSSFFGTGSPVCDGNRSSSWTSTLASATVLFYDYPQPPVVDSSGYRTTAIFGAAYVPTLKSYVLTGNVVYMGTFSWSWAPQPWGPFYLTGNQQRCPASAVNCNDFGFNYLMGFGATPISTNPPDIQMRVSNSVDLNVHNPPNTEGNPGFYQAEITQGRMPYTLGISRHADFISNFGLGQVGMGHRFITGMASGMISRRGLDLQGSPYTLDWWYGGWDHGGSTNAIYRPYMMDEVTAGARYWQPWRESPNKNDFSGGISLNFDGIALFTGNDTRLLSNFNDTTLSSNGGNASWTMALVFKITSPTGTGMQNTGGSSIPLFSMGGTSSCPNCGAAAQTTVEISVGRGLAGNVCLAWGGNSHPSASICTNSAVISSTTTWYYAAISAKAQSNGYPTVSMVICSAGSCSEYGGVNMQTVGNGFVGNGLIKACGSSLPSCSANMIVATDTVQFAHDPSSSQSINGVFGEGGLWLGTVPNSALREIYKTLSNDWSRTGRGVL